MERTLVEAGACDVLDMDEVGEDYLEEVQELSLVEVAGQFVMKRHDDDLAEIKELFAKYSKTVESWCQQ